MRSVDELLDEAERRSLVGWDLTFDGRIDFTPPWDIDAIVDAWLAGAPDLLDMGTGGGEWLSRRAFPTGRTVATEGWAPNVAVAAARLGPLGVSVIAVDGAPDNVAQGQGAILPSLPFADGTFHRIVNRHESFVAAEVARVLAPGGEFLTQQVGSDLGAPFRALLASPPEPSGSPWTLAVATRQVEAAGLVITDRAEGAAQTTFADVRALAWYLLNVPWVMPAFRIAPHRAALARLHGQALSVPQPMFWLVARKR